MQNDKEVQKDMAFYLSKYSKQANAKWMSENRGHLSYITQDELERRKGHARYFRAYIMQQLNFIKKERAETECAIAFFDEEGCLLQMKASEKMSQQLEDKKIRVGSLWQLNEMGPNAVTIGQRHYCSGMTAGDENYLFLLKEFAIYYCPVILREKGQENLHGGIALFVPYEERHPVYMTLAVNMAWGMLVRLNGAWNTSDAYEAESRGMVMVNADSKNGIPFITHHNYGFFDILGLPRESLRDSYYQPLASYIDPLPSNKEFWNIIGDIQIIQNREMTLSVHGRRVECILTTAPSGRLNLGKKDMLVYITSRQQVVKQVAKKTGNNAILTFDDIVGNSPVMRSRIKRARLLSRTDSNIMLLGESGVGKDVFAQAIHNNSVRSKKPFVAVNCGAIPRDLIASELFGYDGGAFTGAKKEGNIGKFELANGGTLFLDEIGEMPLDLQASLLRAVEQKQFMRLGSNKLMHVDVKIISATNVDIGQMIRQRRFRSDLYYRLSTMSIYLPPLREREDDVLILADYFVKHISEKIGRRGGMYFSEEAKDFMRKCSWEGNVRELQNLVECLVQLYPDEEITLDMLHENLNPLYFEEKQYQSSIDAYKSTDGLSGDELDLKPGKRQYTREEILEVLKETGGNRCKAAQRLGIGRRTFYRYIEKYNIGNK